MVAAAANVHDTKLLRQTLEDIVVARQGVPGSHGEPGKPRRTCLRIRDMTAPRAVRRSLTGDAGRKFDA